MHESLNATTACAKGDASRDGLLRAAVYLFVNHLPLRAGVTSHIPMKTYNTPAIAELGAVATLTADSGENASSDTVFRISGREAGIGGSIDSCNFGVEDEECLPSTGA